MPYPIKTKRFFACPNGCDYDFAVEHIFAGDYLRDVVGVQLGVDDDPHGMASFIDVFDAEDDSVTSLME